MEERNAEHCVCCGATIPEGRMMCPGCEEGQKVKFKRAGVFLECQGCGEIWDTSNNEGKEWNYCPYCGY